MGVAIGKKPEPVFPHRAEIAGENRAQRSFERSGHSETPTGRVENTS